MVGGASEHELSARYNLAGAGAVIVSGRGVRAEVVNWVLRKPPPAERDAIHTAIDESLACLPLLLAGEMERATMKINARPKPPKVAQPPPEKTDAGDSAR